MNRLAQNIARRSKQSLRSFVNASKNQKQEGRINQQEGSMNQAGYGASRGQAAEQNAKNANSAHESQGKMKNPQNSEAKEYGKQK